MSSHEFSEWVAFYGLEPFGYAAEFAGHAQTAAVIANVHRGKNTTAFKVTDFMPREPKPPQTVPQMIEMAAAWTTALGGEVDIQRGEPSEP